MSRWRYEISENLWRSLKLTLEKRDKRASIIILITAANICLSRISATVLSSAAMCRTEWRGKTIKESREIPKKWFFDNSTTMLLAREQRGGRNDDKNFSYLFSIFFFGKELTQKIPSSLSQQQWVHCVYALLLCSFFSSFPINCRLITAAPKWRLTLLLRC